MGCNWCGGIACTGVHPLEESDLNGVQLVHGYFLCRSESLLGVRRKWGVTDVGVWLVL